MIYLHHAATSSKRVVGGSTVAPTTLTSSTTASAQAITALVIERFARAAEAPEDIRFLLMVALLIGWR